MKPLRCLAILAVLGACKDDVEPAPAPERLDAETAEAASTGTSAPQPADAGELEVAIHVPAEVEETATFEASCTVEGATEGELRFEWSHAGGEPRIVIPRSFAPTVELRAPDAVADYEAVLAVRVRSGDRSGRAEARIRVRADDDPPVPELIAPQSAECGEIVALVGQAHNEIHQGVTVEWIQVGEGPRVEIDGRERLQASFVAPEHGAPYEVALEMRLRDGVHPDSIARAKVAIDCDPDSSPLPAGSRLALISDVGVESPLPRGPWEIEGSLELATEEGKPFTARIQLVSGSLGAALELAGDGAETRIGTVGLSPGEGGGWIVPEWNGGIALGPWPAGVPLAFLLESDGREVSVRFGPPGPRESWPELPMTIVLPLGKRPRGLSIDVVGAEAKVGPIELRAR